MSLLLSPMLWRIVGTAAILAGLAWGYHLWVDHQREVGRVEVRAEWQADKLARSEATRILVAANAKTSSDLQATADKERQALNEKNRTIGRDLAAALERLRDRPERPESSDSGERVPEVAGPAGTGAWATGAQLHRQDAEFLVRESARADQLRLALRSCRADYQRAQAAVNGG